MILWLTYYSSKGHQLGAWAGYFESLSVILCRHFFLYGNILDFLNHFVREASPVGHWALPCRGYRRLKQAQWLSKAFRSRTLLILWFNSFTLWKKLEGFPIPLPTVRTSQICPRGSNSAPLLFQLSKTSDDIAKHLHLCCNQVPWTWDLPIHLLNHQAAGGWAGSRGVLSGGEHTSRVSTTIRPSVCRQRHTSLSRRFRQLDNAVMTRVCGGEGGSVYTLEVDSLVHCPGCNRWSLNDVFDATMTWKYGHTTTLSSNFSTVFNKLSEIANTLLWNSLSLRWFCPMVGWYKHPILKLSVS